MDLKNIRINYKKSKIDFSNLEDNPIVFFLNWFEDALRINKYEANACVLSTVSSQQKPSSRVVLLKDISQKGFVFFTNYKSRKSLHIEDNNHVALNFYWPELERQVRILGKAEKINSNESDDYFNSRPRESQMGAWLSDQSSELDLNYDFQCSLDELEDRFKGKKISRPLNWGGYCVVPNSIEFWQGRPSRLHDRVLYSLDRNMWCKTRLSP